MKMFLTLVLACSLSALSLFAWTVCSSTLELSETTSGQVENVIVLGSFVGVVLAVHLNHYFQWLIPALFIGLALICTFIMSNMALMSYRGLLAVLLLAGCGSIPSLVAIVVRRMFFKKAVA